MIKEIKSALLVFGFICALMIPSYFIYKYLNIQKIDYVSSHSGILKGQSKWILASRIQYYSDLQEAKKWYTTKAWVYYKWESINEYGIDFGNGNWNWNLEYNNGIVNVIVPKLQFFGSKIGLGKDKFIIKIVNKAVGIKESELISKNYDNMNNITEADGIKELDTTNLIEICRKSVSELIMNLLNQSNSNLKIHKVNVTFSNEQITK